MMIEKNTLETGIVRYTITSGKHPDAGVQLDIRGDGTYELDFEAGYHVLLDDERVRMLKQALSFIDGHRLNQP